MMKLRSSSESVDIAVNLMGHTQSAQLLILVM